MGPITTFDKSALQALSMDEAVWFDAFFLANVVPVFYVETLADLEKDVAKGKTPDDLVGMLAEKTPSQAYPNVHHRHILLGELTGEEIPMTGQVLIGEGETKVAPDGSVGLHVGEFPEQAALLRWRNHEFLEIEREVARDWRAELAQQDPAAVVGALKNVLPTDTKISTLEELKDFVDSFCSSDDPQVFQLALDVLGVPDEYQRLAVTRWQAVGRPRLDEFAPYLTHVLKVDLVFYLGIHRSFISGERASNKADMAYLYYLPFAMVFTSSDRLHQRTVPLFLREDQSYLGGEELKSALHEFDEHYDALPEPIKDLGVLAFAPYPPSTIDNAVTRLWDKHMRPDWRESAKSLEVRLGKPRDEADREIPADVKQRMEKARPVSDEEANLSPEGPDYAFVSRYVPATKGKWRMVSEEVAEADAQN